MATERFVLRYGGQGATPEADVALVRGLTGVEVVETSPRMLLVESEAEPLRALVDALPDWVMAPDRAYAVPDTRKTVDRPPA